MAGLKGRLEVTRLEAPERLSDKARYRPATFGGASLLDALDPQKLRVGGLFVRHDLAVSGLGEAQRLIAAKVEGDEWGRCSIIQLRWWPWAVSSSFGWVCSSQL